MDSEDSSADEVGKSAMSGGSGVESSRNKCKYELTAWFHRTFVSREESALTVCSTFVCVWGGAI